MLTKKSVMAGKSANSNPIPCQSHWPNRNQIDIAEQMRSGTSDDYTRYQTACLTGGRSARVQEPIAIAGTSRAVAETTLQITSQFSGDNYQVRASMQKPHNLEPFDKRSSWTTNDTYVTSSIKESETMIAWKRVYIEQDNMYKLGATITANAPAGETNLTVDSTADFSVGDSVVVFWTNGSFNTTIMATSISSVTISNGLPQAMTPYAGIRPAIEPATYLVDRRFLAQAFGSTPDGSSSGADAYPGQGAGAFIEFLDAPTGGGKVPKFSVFPSSSRALTFSQYWFRNRNESTSNIRYLLAANRQSQSGAPGWAWHTLGIAIVFDGMKTSVEQRDDTTVHEIGHLFNLVRPPFAHIDYDMNQRTHCDQDRCVMSYQRNRTDGIVEFCMECLLSGSTGGAGNSLRDRNDQ
jgi:hypothetical protein